MQSPFYGINLTKRLKPKYLNFKMRIKKKYFGETNKRYKI